ncbi:hypothetical protein FRAHR75_640001 [Frankia sp. Hr75.2]|nr:hypothetical protein FRAHR75_640001 [Frankia sp. Hr75.2]
MAHAGRSACSAWATAMPSRPGICRSSSATSGRWSRAVTSASGPDAACATTVMSSSMDRTVHNANRYPTIPGPTITIPDRRDRPSTSRNARPHRRASAHGARATTPG